MTKQNIFKTKKHISKKRNKNDNSISKLMSMKKGGSIIGRPLEQSVRKPFSMEGPSIPDVLVKPTSSFKGPLNLKPTETLGRPITPVGHLGRPGTLQRPVGPLGTPENTTPGNIKFSRFNSWKNNNKLESTKNQSKMTEPEKGHELLQKTHMIIPFKPTEEQLKLNKTLGNPNIKLYMPKNAPIYNSGMKTIIGRHPDGNYVLKFIPKTQVLKLGEVPYIPYEESSEPSEPNKSSEPSESSESSTGNNTYLEILSTMTNPKNTGYIDIVPDSASTINSSPIKTTNIVTPYEITPSQTTRKVSLRTKINRAISRLPWKSKTAKSHAHAILSEKQPMYSAANVERVSQFLRNGKGNTKKSGKNKIQSYLNRSEIVRQAYNQNKQKKNNKDKEESLKVQAEYAAYIQKIVNNKQAKQKEINRLTNKNFTSNDKNKVLEHIREIDEKIAKINKETKTVILHNKDYLPLPIMNYLEKLTTFMSLQNAKIQIEKRYPNYFNSNPSIENS